MHVGDIEYGKRGIHVRFRTNNMNGARAKAGYGHDRFIELPAEIMGALDLYLTDIWGEVQPTTDHLWITLNRQARDQDGQTRYRAPLTIAAVESMFRYYSHRSGIKLHPHMLRHTHATELVRSYLNGQEPVDWKFIQERLRHASVVTTMETYVHLTAADHHAAYERFRRHQEG